MNKFYYQPSPNQLILWSYAQKNAELKPAQREKLREVLSGWRGALLREEAIIQVTGHSGPGEDDCQNVAFERNQGVYLLLCAHGCDGTKIYRKAVGNSYPLDSSLLDRWRERNRRVELTLLKVVDQTKQAKERGLSAKISERAFPKMAKGNAELERELAWEEENPQGKVLEEAHDKYILWNFGVGQRTLKAEHRQELIKILPRIAPWTKIRVEGHISKNEASQDEDKLAAMRAAEVCEFLLRFKVRQDNIISSFYGASKPLYPNLSGGNMARNRRVEVTLLQAKAQQETAQGKGTPQMTVELQRGQGAAVSGPNVFGFRLEKLIPNQTYNLEYSLPMYPFVHSVFVVQPYIEFEGSVQLVTASSLGFEIGRNLDEKQIGDALKYKLDEYNEFEIGTEGKISLENERLFLSPEFQASLLDLDGQGIKEPFSLLLTLRDLPLADVKLGEGITGKGTVKVKLKFVFRPNWELIGLKLGARGVLSLGVSVVLIGGAVYMTLKLPEMIEEATDEKIKEHKANALLEGYAFRLTVELVDRTWQKYLEEYLHSMYVNTAYGAYEDCQIGWQKAATFLHNIAANGQLAEFLTKMKKRYPQKHPIALEEELYRQLKTLYNYETGEMPHPYELYF